MIDQQVEFPFGFISWGFHLIFTLLPFDEAGSKFCQRSLSILT
ncbi:hypothetical protein Isop_2936 [Isosphaera pallida ATCC 43644]|uniref:Uncharacterized protein n=1 Tax=Isosphaera pallida (strain ATCC 43644 / DSM 9630 / IS1B) TaxID=575540 RepID=E8R271_ISOPI|nr:hypothetical protein Isop_2936 [Isosphaera pallida ATCC 43644]